MTEDAEERIFPRGARVKPKKVHHRGPYIVDFPEPLTVEEAKKARNKRKAERQKAVRKA